MSFINRNLVLAGAIAALTLVAQTAEAGVVIAGTRVIFPEQEREVTLRLSNTSQTPSLVQAWIDDGDPRATPEQSAGVPFVIRPPVFRMNAGAGQPVLPERAGRACSSARG
ncbi:hypothetical protein G6F57_014980 [Rhizopus arrhizus]|nr:hypothetical protein G6F31_019364 [Rhizopus arrhizus]KAG1457021.1 hypothetical protein G6F57_014980 [Rhizopus arrhizus]